LLSPFAHPHPKLDRTIEQIQKRMLSHSSPPTQCQLSNSGYECKKQSKQNKSKLTAVLGQVAFDRAE
jgi:hypothetical protein